MTSTKNGIDRVSDAGNAQMRIAFNGKFLSAPPTGVHRVAAELIMMLDRLLVLDAQLRNRFDAVILAPRNATRTLPLKQIRTETVGTLTGQLWEQLDLPFHTEGRVLVSLCNLGPVATRRAVTMIHDAQVYLTPQSYSFAFRRFYRLMQPMMGARHERILTVSDYSRAQLAAAGVAPREKIDVIHNGVDHIARVKPDGAATQAFQLTPFGYVLALANTQAHKNIQVLMRAFAHPDLSPYRLVLFGGANKEAFENSGHSVPPNVIFTGPVSDETLCGLLSNALCLAFPSITEGFGLPPMEAMEMGCPAIVSPCGALPEVCGDAVIYVDPEQPDAWRAAIVDLSEDSEGRNTWVKKGRAQAAAYTWDRSAHRLVAVLDNLACKLS